MAFLFYLMFFPKNHFCQNWWFWRHTKGANRSRAPKTHVFGVCLYSWMPRPPGESQRVSMRLPNGRRASQRDPRVSLRGCKKQGCPREPHSPPRAPPLTTSGPSGTTLGQTCEKVWFGWVPESPKSVLYCKLHVFFAIWNSSGDPADPPEVVAGTAAPTPHSHAPGARMTVVHKLPQIIIVEHSFCFFVHRRVKPLKPV